MSCFFPSQAGLRCCVDEPGHRAEQPAEVQRGGAQLLERHLLPEEVPRLLLQPGASGEATTLTPLTVLPLNWDYRCLTVRGIQGAPQRVK